MTVTPDDYKRFSGKHCPVCGMDFESDSPHWFDKGQLVVDCDCFHCGSTWNEVYLLEKYINLIEGNKHKVCGCGRDKKPFMHNCSATSVMCEAVGCPSCDDHCECCR